MGMTRAAVWYVMALAAWAAAAPSLALAQRANPNLDRYQRQLDQIQRDTSLLANPEVPAGQRLLFDYGGYFTASYLSVDDSNQDNHGLRQYDLVGYARLNLDDVQELYARGRLTWQDFNPGDSFNGQGDQQFIARMDRLYYRFDLQKAIAAYQGRQVDYNVSFEGGRQLVYWANGLSLVQDLDAANVNLNYRFLDLQLLAGITPADTIDIDNSRPHYDTNTHRGFYGAMLSAQAGGPRPVGSFPSPQGSEPRSTQQNRPGSPGLLYQS